MIDHINQKPDIKLWAYTQINPDLPGNHRDTTSMDEIAAHAAKGCHWEGSAVDFWLDHKKNTSQDKIDGFVYGVLKASSGRAHRSVLDQVDFTFSMDYIPRAVTMQLCLPPFPMHLQQSMRFVDAEKGFYVPEGIDRDTRKEVIAADTAAFELYKIMGQKGSRIHTEDRRYALPIGAQTAITTKLNASSKIHLYVMTLNSNAPNIAKEVVSDMYAIGKEKAPISLSDWSELDRSHAQDIHNFMPSQQLYSENALARKIMEEHTNLISPTYLEHNLGKSELNMISVALEDRDEAVLSTLKHAHNSLTKLEGMLVPMSIAAYHQAIRQRTTDLAIMTDIFGAAERGTIVIPPSIAGSKFEESYIELNQRMIATYLDGIQAGNSPSDMIMVAPNSLSLEVLLHLNGFNMTSGFMKDRLCKNAQWEIRDVAWSMKHTFAETAYNNLLETHEGDDELNITKQDIEGLIQSKAQLFGECSESKPCPAGCPTFKGTNPNIFHQLKI
jgi:thymidylate synthase ThyX